jgi:hypothetical protein
VCQFEYRLYGFRVFFFDVFMIFPIFLLIWGILVFLY